MINTIKPFKEIVNEGSFLLLKMVAKYSLSEIDRIYNLCIKQLNEISEKYFKEVDVGENEKMLKKWNDYVLLNLNIDNMKLVESTEKDKKNK